MCIREYTLGKVSNLSARSSECLLTSIAVTAVTVTNLGVMYHRQSRVN